MKRKRNKKHKIHKKKIIVMTKEILFLNKLY